MQLSENSIVINILAYVPILLTNESLLATSRILDVLSSRDEIKSAASVSTVSAFPDNLKIVYSSTER